MSLPPKYFPFYVLKSRRLLISLFKECHVHTCKLKVFNWCIPAVQVNCAAFPWWCEVCFPTSLCGALLETSLIILQVNADFKLLDKSSVNVKEELPLTCYTLCPLNGACYFQEEDSQADVNEAGKKTTRGRGRGKGKVMAAVGSRKSSRTKKWMGKPCLGASV